MLNEIFIDSLSFLDFENFYVLTELECTEHIKVYLEGFIYPNDIGVWVWNDGEVPCNMECLEGWEAKGITPKNYTALKILEIINKSKN